MNGKGLKRILVIILALAMGGLWPASGAEQILVVGTEPPPAKDVRYTRDEVLQFMRDGLAPNFTLQTPEGHSYSLLDYRGSLVIVMFWVSWEPDCLESLALLDQIRTAYADVCVLSVNSLPTESNQAAWTPEARQEHILWVSGYFLENGYGFPALVDPQGELERTHAYQGGGLPMTFFIDRDGILRIPWQGKLSQETVATLLSMMYALDP